MLYRIYPYLKTNSSPRSAISLGTVSKIPVKSNGWPPNANSLKKKYNTLSDCQLSQTSDTSSSFLHF